MSSNVDWAYEDPAFITVYPPTLSCHTFADFPDPKLLMPLQIRTYRRGGPFVYLLQYGRVRYLCFLMFNQNIRDCAENRCLQEVYRGVEANDERLICLGSRECMELFWPFIKDDYTSRPETFTGVIASGTESVVKIQVQTIDGRLRVREHDWEERYIKPNLDFISFFEMENPPSISYQSLVDYLDLELFVPLVMRFYSGARRFMYLLDYDGVRYLLLLRYNAGVKDCAENKRLEESREAFYKEDANRLLQISSECLELFRSYLRQDYEARLGKGEEKPALCEKSTIKIQMQTIDGALHATEHDFKLPYQNGPVDSPFPDLQLFSKTEVGEMLKISSEDVYVTKIGGNYYCVKSLDRSDDGHFLREIGLLRKIGSHPNIVPLAGLIDAGGGKVDGIVLTYIPGISLQYIPWITKAQAQKWKKQISDVVHFLHGQNIVWGDVKAHNILIDQRNDNAVAIDFGGGFTGGWVDRELAGTKKGDLQGLQRILDFIDEKSTGFSYTEPMNVSPQALWNI